MTDVVNLANRLDRCSEQSSPINVCAFNGKDVTVECNFLWHSHPDTADLLLALVGESDIETPDRAATLGEGNRFVVPKRLVHPQVARRAAHLLPIRPADRPDTDGPATVATRVTI